LPQPGWADSGSSPAATPTLPPEAAAPGASRRTWRFSYDDNEAELKSVTDPMGVVTSFHYSTYYSAATNYVRGVSEVHAVDAGSNYRFMRWTRTFPEGSAPMSIKLENKSEAQSELERRREHGTETGGTGVRCEIVRTWVSGVGPIGNQGGSGEPSGQGAGNANQRIIRDLASANDAGKYAADCAAINSYLTSIGKAVLWGAGTGVVTGGEIGATLGGLFGVGVGAVPLGGGGAAGGMVLGGFSGLVPTSVTGGVALRAQFEKNEVNWKANYRAVQNYSDTNCVGAKHEIRY